MTEEPHSPAATPEQHEPESEPHAPPLEEARSHPQEMRLRIERHSVTRLSRRVLVGAGAVACGGIFIALAVALWPHRQTIAPQSVSTGANILPEGVASLPKDYTATALAPKLGPPLPGDLGKPMLKAGVIAPGMLTPGYHPSPVRVASPHGSHPRSTAFCGQARGIWAKPQAAAPGKSAPRRRAAKAYVSSLTPHPGGVPPLRIRCPARSSRRL